MSKKILVCVASLVISAHAFAQDQFVGFWKEDCSQPFGLQIMPAGAAQYSVSFCGPGGCFEPGTYRPNTTLHGDPRYKVISPKEIRVLGRDGWSTYFKCASETQPKLRYSDDCTRGEDAIRERRFSDAVNLSTQCLSQSTIDSFSRAQALKVRAYAYYSLKDYRSAIADQEKAFSIIEPAAHRDFINYALYLRLAGRLEDSLNAVRSAAEIEERTGHTSMMTQYHLGWTLLELGRQREAIDALTRGIPYQPDYPFVYWKRGLAYEELGEKEKARSDFELVARYLSTPEQQASAAAQLPLIRNKLQAYGLDIDIPSQPSATSK